MFLGLTGIYDNDSKHTETHTHTYDNIVITVLEFTSSYVRNSKEYHLKFPIVPSSVSVAEGIMASKNILRPSPDTLNMLPFLEKVYFADVIKVNLLTLK